MFWRVGGWGIGGLRSGVGGSIGGVFGALALRVMIMLVRS